MPPLRQGGTGAEPGPDSRIARASAALHGHLRQGFGPEWGRTSPDVVGGPLPAAHVPAVDEFLLVYLYRLETASRANNAPPPRGQHPGAHSRTPVQWLELHYLVAAFAGEEARMQAILECACRRLHAAPVVALTASSPTGPSLTMLPEPISLEAAAGLWRSLCLPLRPGLSYQTTLALQAG